jgi:putative peptidoglycan lipid II flippase
VAQLNLIVGTVFASLLVDGSQSWLYYSDRLVEFPLGLFGVALATVILPHLSRRSADADAEGYASALDWGLRTVLLLAIPAALGLALLAEPLAATIFERGEFNAADSRMTALSLVAMSLGIPGFMVSKVLLSAFYARQDTRTPMKAAIRTVLINVALTAALVTPLWLGAVPGAHAGIALATGLAGLANAWLLWRALRRQAGFALGPGWRRHLLRIALASVALAAAVLAANHAIGDWRAWSGEMRWLLMFGVVGAGAAGYGLGLLAAGWRPRELRGP